MKPVPVVSWHQTCVLSGEMAEKTEKKRVTGFRPLLDHKVHLAAARIPSPDADSYTSAEFNTDKPKTCPKCGNRFARNETTCGFCYSQRQRNEAYVTKVIGASIGVTIVAAVLLFAVPWHSRKPAAPAIPPDGTWLPQPDATANLPKSMDNLKIGRFYVARERGSDVVVVSGDIENISNHIHRGLKARVDLLDLEGKTVATVEDVINQLSGRRTWHIIARTNSAKAVNARFAKLTEAP